MSFGLQNLGVINQKDAPAIWESSVANFPANFVKGRILIDNVYGGIYLDTTTTRIQIQAQNNGNVTFVNGLTSQTLTPNSTQISLEGYLINETHIALDSFAFYFDGSVKATYVNPNGYLVDDSSGWILPAMDTDTLGAITPNIKLLFVNPATNKVYEVSAFEQP